MKFKLQNFPKITHLPRLTLGPVTKAVSFLGKHKISIMVLVGFILFLTTAMWYRGYLLSKMNLSAQTQNGDNGFYSSSTGKQLPTPIPPTPFPTDSNTLGTINYTYATPTPFPTLSPFPTVTPFPTIAPIKTTTSSNSSGNSHCTTGSGTPNTWYSDVYPNPPISVGSSVTMQVVIRDCNQSTAPVSDKLTVSLVSGDQNTQVNGNNLPYQITTQNGQVSFSVTSQVAGSVTISVHDDTNGFNITNISNQNPTINFGGSSGNSHCTTPSGTPNFWYSDITPTSPASVNAGQSVTFTVHIRDCTQADISSDHITFSLSSGDSSVTINGATSPVSAYAQNGVATFTVLSTNGGIDTFTVHDDSANFTVTDNNNHNPSIIFNGSTTPAATATPTPTTAPAATDTPTPTLTPVPPTPTGGQ
jgi:hypothetical protein